MRWRMSARSKADLPPSLWWLNPGYEISLEPVLALLRVEFGGEVVVESEHAQLMYELGHPPVYYFRRDGLCRDLLTPSDHHTHCPCKGDAGYFSVNAGGRSAKNAVWYYDEPYEEMAHIAGLLGLYFDRFDPWYENGRRVVAPREKEARINAQNNSSAAHPKPAADWHPDKNPGIRPYEFSEHSDTVVWWKNLDGEWQESIRSRVPRNGS